MAFTLPERIVEGDQKDFVDEIQKLAHNKTASPHGRVHAMWALAGLGKLKESTVVQAIEDKDWFISMTGLRLAVKVKVWLISFLTNLNHPLKRCSPERTYNQFWLLTQDYSASLVILHEQ